MPLASAHARGAHHSFLTAPPTHAPTLSALVHCKH